MRFLITCSHLQLTLVFKQFNAAFKLYQNFNITNQQVFAGALKTDYEKQPLEVLCKKVVLKNFENFTGNTCATVSFLPATLLKRDSYTGVFYVKFAKSFTNTYFGRTSAKDCFQITSRQLLLITEYSIAQHSSIAQRYNQDPQKHLFTGTLEIIKNHAK